MKYKIFDSDGSWLGDITADSIEEALELAKTAISPEASRVEERAIVNPEQHGVR